MSATLWEEGRRPGREVALLALAAAIAIAWLDVALTGRLSFFFDVWFVPLCLVAALAVRPRDFFYVGVLPPLLLLAVSVSLALLTPAAVADARDGMAQAVVTGLATHARALLIGYAVALGVLLLRRRLAPTSAAEAAQPKRAGSPAPTLTTSA